MTIRRRRAGRAGQPAEPTHGGAAGYDGHGWLMIACCIPILVIAVALLVTGAAKLVVVLLLTGLYVAYYRHLRRIPENQHRDDSAASRLMRDDVDPARIDLGRLWRDMAAASSLRSPARFSPEPPCATGAPLQTDEEQREAALSHQVIEGAIHAEAYRWQMGELAGHRSGARESQ